MKKNPSENYMTEVGKELKDYLYLSIIKGGNNQVSIDCYKKYFLPRVKTESYNIETDGRKFYDRPINDLIKQYDEIRKISTRQGDDYATGYLLDFSQKKNSLIVADLSKQKALDADFRAIQQIFFTGKVEATEDNTRVIVIIYYVLEKSKETN